MTTVAFTAGCLSVTEPRLFSAGRPRLAECLLRELTARQGVAGASLDLDRGDCQVRWTSADVTAQAAAAAFVAALRAAQRIESHHRRARWWGRAADGSRPRRQAPGELPASLVRGPRRALYIAAGGGCVALTLVGAVVPGIPTVPFLLASSYLLARSSPTLHRALTATPVFGRIVTEWDTRRAMSRRSKLTLMGLVVTVVAISFSVVRVEPTMLLVVAVVVSGSVYGISRIPERGSTDTMPGRLAAPAATNGRINATISASAAVANGA
jgi:uncharacterized membrane protein YbaN (DUF454 family)